MFSDLKTNTVYFSEFFKLRFPGIIETVRCNLEVNGINVYTLQGNQNIWIRDYMPVQVNNHFVKFTYKKDFKEYPWLNVPEKCFKMISVCADSKIVLDGGNIVRSNKFAIITEKVIADNPYIDRNNLLQQLSTLLGGVQIVIIPMEPGDALGHSDGICKFIDDNTILFNDYSSMQSKDFNVFTNKCKMILQSAGIDVKLFPNAYHLCPHLYADDFYDKYPFADSINPAYGYYINFILTKSCIIAPVFGVSQDEEAISALKKYYPDHSVIAVDCSELSMEGGLMNCVSWNFIR